MSSERDARRRACLDKAAAEVDSLAARGVITAGNAFSSVLLAKGQMTDAEKSGAAPFGGADGDALRASLKALGYAPEDAAYLLTCDLSGAALDAGLLREAICVIDPATLVLCDDAAVDAVREAYADDLTILEDFNEAMLMPGYVVAVCGMRVLNLGGFASALEDKQQKQLMWARLKLIPPLAEPY
jgi:hypothetical protein